jgi:hypothetical protein
VQRLISSLARSEPLLAELSRFLSPAYDLKDIADYEVGPGAGVPLDRAAAAIEAGAQLIDQIAALAWRPIRSVLDVP